MAITCGRHCWESNLRKVGAKRDFYFPLQNFESGKSLPALVEERSLHAYMYAESAPGRKVFFSPLQRGDRGAGASSAASFLRVEVFLLVAWMETGRAEGSLYFDKLYVGCTSSIFGHKDR